MAEWASPREGLLYQNRCGRVSRPQGIKISMNPHDTSINDPYVPLVDGF